MIDKRGPEVSVGDETRQGEYGGHLILTCHLCLSPSESFFTFGSTHSPTQPPFHYPSFTHSISPFSFLVIFFLPLIPHIFLFLYLQHFSFSSTDVETEPGQGEVVA